MKLAILPFLLFSASVVHAQESVLSVIPRPLEVKRSAGHYVIRNKITVSSDFPSLEWDKLFPFLLNEMKQRYRIELIQIKELNADILKITMLIQDQYPELSKFIDEMQVTIPDEKHPEITLTNLKKYYDSLNLIVNKYKEENIPPII